MSKRPSTSSSPVPKQRRTWTPLTAQQKQFILERYALGEGATRIAQTIERPPGTVFAFIRKSRQQNISPEAAMEISMNCDIESSDEDELAVFQMSLEQRGYSQKQVLSFQETGLVWKMMSKLTDQSGLRADRVTLVIGGNAEGDWKLKPLLVYHTENPKTLQGYIKEHFPIIWKTHPQVLVTSDSLQSYVVGYLSLACKEYAKANNLPNKFLLIMDNHLAHTPSISQWAENIEVLFLPSHLQPMEQGVVDIFKRYYHRRVVQQLVRVINEGGTTEEFWRQYSIKKAIHNISHSWNQVEEFIMNAVWCKVWPEAGPGSLGIKGVEDLRQQLIRDIVRTLNQAEISQVGDEGVEKLFERYAQVPSEEEQAQIEPEETEDPDPSQQITGLNKTELKELLEAVNRAIAIAENQDLNMSRSDTFSQALESAIMRYQKIYDDL